MTWLTDYAATVLLEDLDGGGGRVNVVPTFEAETLRAAVAHALQLVEPAVDEPASGVEVLPAEGLRRPHEQHEQPYERARARE